MTPDQRQRYLMIAVGAVVGLWLLDSVVLGRVSDYWSEQSKQIQTLRDQVKHGHALIDSAASTRARWEEMKRSDLPPESSTAQNMVIKGVSRWVLDSHITLTNLNITPTMQTHEDGHETLECHATATGDQQALGKLLYDLETDALPVRLEDCEFSTRDKAGKLITLNLRFSFLRLAAAANSQ